MIHCNQMIRVLATIAAFMVPLFAFSQVDPEDLQYSNKTITPDSIGVIMVIDTSTGEYGHGTINIPGGFPAVTRAYTNDSTILYIRDQSNLTDTIYRIHFTGTALFAVDSVASNGNGTFTFYYTDNTTYTTEDLTGVSIDSVRGSPADSTIRVYLSNLQVDTLTGFVGPTGATGISIDSVRSFLVDTTMRVYLSNGQVDTITAFRGPPGQFSVGTLSLDTIDALNYKLDYTELDSTSQVHFKLVANTIDSLTFNGGILRLYDGGSTTPDSVDLSALDVANISFDSQRPITRVPVVGDSIGGSTLEDFLEHFYIEPPTITLNATPATTYFEVGTAPVITLSGATTNNGGATLSNGKITATQGLGDIHTFGASATYTDPVIYTPLDPSGSGYDAHTLSFTTTQDWQIGSIQGTATSPTYTINAVYPILTGMSAIDYVSADNFYVDSDATKQIADQSSAESYDIIFNGTTKRPYIFVPSSVSLSSVQDNINNEVIQNFDVYTDIISTPLDIAIDPNNNKLYLADDQGISRYNLDGTNKELVLAKSETQNPTLITIDEDNSKIYWHNETGAKARWRADLDMSNQELWSSVGEPDEFYTMLWIRERDGEIVYYWYHDELSSYYQGIPSYQVSDGDFDLKDPNIVAGHVSIDADTSYIYYLDSIGSGHYDLYRTELNGAGDTVINTSFDYTPIIKVDTANSRLYFYDPDIDSIFYTDLLGSNRVNFIPGNGFIHDAEINHGTGEIYWIVRSTNKVYKSSLTSNTTSEVLGTIKVTSTELNDNWSANYKMYKYKWTTSIDNITWKLTIN